MNTGPAAFERRTYPQLARGNNDGGASAAPGGTRARDRLGAGQRNESSRKFATPRRERNHRDGTERTRGAYTCHRGRHDPYGACGTSHGFLLMNPLVHRKERHTTPFGPVPVPKVVRCPPRSRVGAVSA